jgi:hypothetical protein
MFVNSARMWAGSICGSESKFFAREAGMHGKNALEVGHMRICLHIANARNKSYH